MEIILNKYIERLGDKNDVVTVKPGYARNFLIPRGLAHVATESSRKVADQNRAQAMHKAYKIKEVAQNMADSLKDQSVTIHAKASLDSEKIFGSVTSLQISEAIKKQYNSLVESKNIKVDTPIKTLGTHEVVISLHKEVEFSMQVSVERE